MSADARHGQTWDPDSYARHAGFVPELGASVLDLLASKAGERILDLGCGDGALTVGILETGASVIGVDSSVEQVAAARERGVDARVADGHDLQFEREFDAVFSNAALHWMTRPDAVIAGVARALRPGGRFVAEFGGAGNVGKIRRALHKVLMNRGLDPKARDPWYFPTGEDYTARLEAAGFEVESVRLIDRPTPLPTDMTGWLSVMGGAFVEGLPDPAAAVSEAVELLRADLFSPDTGWTADYVRLRFSARLTG